jgi:hypothetical protein
MADDLCRCMGDAESDTRDALYRAEPMRDRRREALGAWLNLPIRSLQA